MNKAIAGCDIRSQGSIKFDKKRLFLQCKHIYWSLESFIYLLVTAKLYPPFPSRTEAHTTVYSVWIFRFTWFFFLYPQWTLNVADLCVTSKIYIPYEQHIKMDETFMRKVQSTLRFWPNFPLQYHTLWLHIYTVWRVILLYIATRSLDIQKKFQCELQRKVGKTIKVIWRGISSPLELHIRLNHRIEYICIK